MRDEGLQSYYARRAREYDRIHDKPERAADLARLRGMVQGLVALEDGTTVRVLKNFPFEGEVASVLAGRAADLVEVRLTYYWVAHYTIGKAIAE